MNPQQIIFKKYELCDFIKEGNFGSIFLGKNIKNGQEVAIKREKISSQFSTIKHEVSILKYLYDHKIKHIPVVHWFGKIENFFYFVMPLYECSLYDYIECKTISKSKIKSIIIQVLVLLKSIHALFLIHRDIKPQNFMVHNGEIYLIDFGFSIFYIDETRRHFIDNQEQTTITGSPRFVSYNIYDGYKPSRRDDLLSVAYIYLYLFYKELPWDNIHLFHQEAPSTDIFSERNREIKALKSFKNVSNYCSQIHPYMIDFMKHIYELSYFEEPSYGFLIDLVEKMNA